MFALESRVQGGLNKEPAVEMGCEEGCHGHEPLLAPKSNNSFIHIWLQPAEGFT